jgi:hypothetical protein
MWSRIQDRRSHCHATSSNQNLIIFIDSYTNRLFKYYKKTNKSLAQQLSQTHTCIRRSDLSSRQQVHCFQTFNSRRCKSVHSFCSILYCLTNPRSGFVPHYKINRLELASRLYQASQTTTTTTLFQTFQQDQKYAPT